MITKGLGCGVSTCNYPAVSDVRAGIVYAVASTGTLALPSTAQVLSGVGYGAGSTEYTGALNQTAIYTGQLEVIDIPLEVIEL